MFDKHSCRSRISKDKLLTSIFSLFYFFVSLCPKMKSFGLDDSFLLTFLRGCKFSHERTKAKLDLYYTIKATLPDWFEDWDPEDAKIKEMLSLG